MDQIDNGKYGKYGKYCCCNRSLVVLLRVANCPVW